MASPRIFAILGSTGNQGGSIANTFLGEPGWQVRALTRNTSSPKAQALTARGAEVVYVDINKPETFPAAFEGASAIFAVTDFWGIYGDPANQDKPKPGQPLNAWAGEFETQQLKSIIDAVAKVPTLERFILSSLSNVTKWSKGKYTHVYHFDSKANATEYGRKMYPDLWTKTSIFQSGYFLSNYVSNPITQASKNDEGVVQFIGHIEPDVKIPFIAAEEDTGPIVKRLIDESAGKNVIGYREWLTVPELALSFTKATGMKAESVTLPKGEFHIPLPDELKLELEENFAAFNEFGYESRDDPTVVHPQDLESPPSLDTVENYWKKQDWSKIFGA
ncbi:Putative NmrA-like domain, NAD(P)-binding domain superfamily [Colletotrichum destructivum]|uniref:NmrA-like domain, NAD(P)-binding domain superfamily n=1 Tax=Colletotrichum destructivum TaxID=34406 RepID=A0AAX4J480_9PEZI|nr:Putative NmrA-like domain, NAD(P)-binding domain superfamily [Colletotrichum destructivum]